MSLSNLQAWSGESESVRLIFHNLRRKRLTFSCSGYREWEKREEGWVSEIFRGGEKKREHHKVEDHVTKSGVGGGMTGVCGYMR